MGNANPSNPEWIAEQLAARGSTACEHSVPACVQQPKSGPKHVPIWPRMRRKGVPGQCIVWVACPNYTEVILQRGEKPIS